MDFSKLSRDERMAAIASAVIIVSGLISIATGWGALMWLPVLAGVGALVVLFAGQVMPATRLPGSNGSLLTVLGAIALLVWIVVLLDLIDFVIANPINLDTWQFVIGLAASAYLAWTGWRTLQAEGGRLQFGGGAAPAQVTQPSTAPDAAAPAERASATPVTGADEPSDATSETEDHRSV